ncbi:hypothetical protein ACFLZX_05835 [Nanoarchaeota archaeon]
MGTNYQPVRQKNTLWDSLELATRKLTESEIVPSNLYHHVMSYARSDSSNVGNVIVKRPVHFIGRVYQGLDSKLLIENTSDEPRANHIDRLQPTVSLSEKARLLFKGIYEVVRWHNKKRGDPVGYLALRYVNGNGTQEEKEEVISELRNCQDAFPSRLPTPLSVKRKNGKLQVPYSGDMGGTITYFKSGDYDNVRLVLPPTIFSGEKDLKTTVKQALTHLELVESKHLERLEDIEKLTDLLYDGLALILPPDELLSNDATITGMQAAHTFSRIADFYDSQGKKDLANDFLKSIITIHKRTYEKWEEQPLTIEESYKIIEEVKDELKSKGTEVSPLEFAYLTALSDARYYLENTFSTTLGSLAFKQLEREEPERRDRYLNTILATRLLPLKSAKRILHQWEEESKLKK